MSRPTILPRRMRCAKLRVAHLEDRVTPAIVTWDHGGNDNNWTTPANWSNDMVPGMNDDVELISSVNTVYYNGGGTTIKSLKLADSLQVDAGAFNITNGVVAGNNQSLIANSNLSSITVSGTSDISAGGVLAQNGGTITMNGITSINNTWDSYNDAQGVGSVVNFPDLTTITSGDYSRHFRAYQGGHINLPLLTSISGGNFQIQAVEAGSELNAPNLATISLPQYKFGYIQTLGGGTMQLSPNLKTLERVQLEVTGTGFPTSQFTAFNFGYLYVLGGSPSFVNLSNIDSSSIYVSQGAIVNMSAVTSIGIGMNGEQYFDAADAGSSLDFPSLTSVNNSNYRVHFRARYDATVSINGLTSLAAGGAELSATDNGHVDAVNLTTFSPPINNSSYITATTGGVVDVSPTFKVLDRTELRVNGTGFPTQQLTTFNHGAIIVESGSPSFAALSNINSSNVAAYGGSTVSLPLVTALTAPDSWETYFDANDAGTTLSLPNLTSVAKQDPYRVHFRASYSGTLNANQLTSLADGNSELRAVAGGVVNMLALNSFSPPMGSFSYLGTVSGGIINHAAPLTTLNHVQLEVENASYPTNQLTAFTNGRLYLYGDTPTFNNLANLDGSDVYAYYGAVVNFPLVTSLSPSEAIFSYIDSAYGKSIVTFPNLTTVAAYSGRISFRCLNEGTINLNQLTSLSAGSVELRATGDGAIHAPMLNSFSPPSGLLSYLTSAGNSTVTVAAGLTKMDGVTLEVDAATAFPIAQLVEFTNGAIYGDADNLNFALASNLNGSSIYINDFCTATFPSAVSINSTNTGTTTFQTYGTDAYLSFPNLTSFTSSVNRTTALRVYYKGAISMPALTTLNTGPVDFYAAGMDAVLDLAGLTELTTPLPSAGYVSIADNATFKSASSLSLFNIYLSFVDTSHFTFANLDIGANCVVTGFGTLKANVTNGAELRPGGYGVPNTLTIDGNFTQTSSGLLRVDLGGTSPGNLYDQVVVTGQAKLGGTVDVLTIFGFQPAVNDVFAVVTYASRMGNFTGYSGLDVGNNVELVPVHGMTDFEFQGVNSTGAIVTGFSPTGTVAGEVSYLEVTFSEAVQGNSVDAADISLTGPGGPYTFNFVVNSLPNQLRFYFTTPIIAEGVYNVVIGPGILDLANNPMNQNGVAPNGEIPGDQYNNSFTIAASDLVVENVTGVPATANFGQTLNIGWTVRNIGTVTTAGVWTDRIWLSTNMIVDFGDISLGEKLSPGLPLAANGTYMSSLAVQLPTLPPVPDGAYYILVQSDVFGQLAESNENNNVSATATTVVNPPRVAEAIVNTGAAQRSRVNSLTVVFSESVTFSPNAAAAFSVARTGPGMPIGALTLDPPVVDNSTSQTKVTLTFMNDAYFSANSLIDGNYQLTVNAGNVSDGTQSLDGNSDGVTGDSHTFNFFRLFGDSNGDRSVTASDFNDFRLAYGGGPSIFDFNDDGLTTATDFNAFRTRYGVTLVP